MSIYRDSYILSDSGSDCHLVTGDGVHGSALT